MAKKGHNVKEVVNAGELKNFVSRILHLEEDKAAIVSDIKVEYEKAKGTGYDPKIIRAAIKRMNEDKQKRQEFEEMVDLYIDAIGDLAGTPLGNAAKPD